MAVIHSSPGGLVDVTADTNHAVVAMVAKENFILLTASGPFRESRNVIDKQMVNTGNQFNNERNSSIERELTYLLSSILSKWC